MSRALLLQTRAARVAALAAVLVSCSPAFAEAQARPPSGAAQKPPPRPSGPTPRAGSWEIGGGMTFAGGYDLDDLAPALTRNTTTTGTGPFNLFVSDSDLGSAIGVVGRLGYYLSPRLSVEGGVHFSRPVLTIQLSGDVENAPDVEAEETLDRWVIDGSVVWHFPSRSGTRPRALVPFVFGGAGYLRELHEGQELIETGVEYRAGGGVKYWIGNARRRFGIRGDAGISIRDGGFDFEEKTRTLPVFSASLIYLF